MNDPIQFLHPEHNLFLTIGNSDAEHDSYELIDTITMETTCFDTFPAGGDLDEEVWHWVLADTNTKREDWVTGYIQCDQCGSIIQESEAKTLDFASVCKDCFKPTNYYIMKTQEVTIIEREGDHYYWEYYGISNLPPRQALIEYLKEMGVDYKAKDIKEGDSMDNELIYEGVARVHTAYLYN